MPISKHYKTIKSRIGRALIGRNPFDLAYFFCKGTGLEVGPRNNPYPFGSTCRLSYADIGNALEIETILYDGFRPRSKFDRSQFAKIDYVLTGPKYGFDLIESNFFDFVYSDNVLEHTPNPIFALIEQLRVTKVGGYVYVVIPNKIFTFDKGRASTPTSLLIEKYQRNIFFYTIDEALDVILNSENFPIAHLNSDLPQEFAKKMITTHDGSYHYHVFDNMNILELVDYVCRETHSTLRYFSAPNFKYIHIAICKGI